jgi:hypothetical protein
MQFSNLVEPRLPVGRPSLGKVALRDFFRIAQILLCPKLCPEALPIKPSDHPKVAPQVGYGG